MSNIPCANAAGITTSDSETDAIATTMSAYLTDDQGNTELVIGRLVDTNCGDGASIHQLSETDNDDNIYATYQFDVYSDGETMSAQALSTTVTESGIDSGYCSTVYLTIKCYHTGEIDDKYLLTNVSGHWSVSDPKASVKSAKLQYGCKNLADNSTANQVEYGRAVSNNFSVNTGFKVYVPKFNFGTTVRAALTLTYLMGTARTWTFTLYNTIVS